MEKILQEKKSFCKGKILDIGSGTRRYDSWIDGEVIAIDIAPSSEQNILFGDIEKGLAFESNSFDGFLCIEVLQYTHNFEKALQEMQRLLKVNGYGIIVVPHFYPEHGENILFSKKFISQKLAEVFAEVETIPFGNFYTSLADLFRLKIRRCKTSFFRNLGFVLILPFIGIVKLFSFDKNTDDFYSGTLLVVKK